MDDQTRDMGGMGSTGGAGGIGGTGSIGGMGGAANTPAFGDPAFGDSGSAVHTADHQLPSETGATGGSQASGGMGGRAEQMTERANQGMKQAAERLDTVAQRIDQMADERLSGTGNRARAGELAHTAADTMESVASYLRNNDVRSLQQDLERQVRERPLQTLLIGVAAGWIVGKILR